ARRALATAAVVGVAMGVPGLAPGPAYAALSLVPPRDRSHAHETSQDAERRAQRAREHAGETAGSLHLAQGDLATLARQANTALGAYQHAAQAAHTAQSRSEQARHHLAAATAAADRQRSVVGSYAVELYRSNGTQTLTLVVGLLTAKD